ncbi:hypothetical protein H072_1098 [Dactylellina haptotyla CBS 200.50]|uniref:Uncharacterized protein n=1 Tax=Dactylellina haptotyla (strain CBS 200.50) TaxID=1284197 RepID=S8APY7_DACHA|nr:hypothetical protein H072_1098 [Dactylellina haptotyla CBS 200.50]
MDIAGQITYPHPMSHQPHDKPTSHGKQDTSMHSIESASNSSSLHGQNSDVPYFGLSPLEVACDRNIPSQDTAKSAANDVLPFEKRTIKPNPMLQKTEDARDRRRNMFLKKIKSHREDKIMEARGGGDEMMRMIYLSERNRWETNQERTASSISSWSMVDDEYEVPEGLQHMYNPSKELHHDLLNSDINMVDAMADIEEKELQELISHLDEIESHFAPATLSQSPAQICRNCGSDEILYGTTESICFNCGTNFDT